MIEIVLVRDADNVLQEDVVVFGSKGWKPCCFKKTVAAFVAEKHRHYVDEKAVRDRHIFTVRTAEAAVKQV